MTSYNFAPPGWGMILCSFKARAVFPANFNFPLKNAYKNIRVIATNQKSEFAA